MIAIFVEGKSEPILVARVSCTKKGGLRFTGENGKPVYIPASTIKNVVHDYDKNTRVEEMV